MPPDAVQAVSFDVWLTLLRSDPRFKPARSLLLQEAFPDSGPPDAFEATVREVDREADRRTATDGLDRDFSARVAMIADRLGRERPGPGLVAALRNRQSALLRELPPPLIDPGLPEALRRLARRRTVAVTSNTGFIPATDLRWVLAHHGVHPTVAVFSDEIGAAKPSPRIFAVLAERCGAPPAGIVHVGDDVDADWRGARRAGLRAMIVSPRRPALRAAQVLT